MKKRILPVVAIAACIIALNIFGARSLDILVISQRLILSNSIIRNLQSPDRHLVYSSLSILGERKNPKAKEFARVYLKTDHGWLHGACYLAELEEQESVPYLIKGLRHKYASGLYPSLAKHLVSLTGENHGTDFDAWKKWWETESSDNTFDFDSNLDVFPDRYVQGSNKRMEKNG